MKTHLPPEAFAGRDPRMAWLLVRDPRDSLYSWYRWSLDFPDNDSERFEGGFEEFLDRPGASTSDGASGAPQTAE
ncbi:hypothetical protein AB0J27_05485 [Micromonospora chokoriensis]